MRTQPDDLALFVAVVKAGSFRQAADNLGVDNSVVSRGVKRLEQKLSTELLTRTTRQVRLTEEGEWFYQRAHRILDDLADAENNLLARRQQPQGILRVDAAAPFILHMLVPIVSEFRQLHQIPVRRGPKRYENPHGIRPCGFFLFQHCPIRYSGIRWL